MGGDEPLHGTSHRRLRPGRLLRRGGAKGRPCRSGISFRWCGLALPQRGQPFAFAAAPEVYTPRFGGHDPMAVARGAATPGHPALWLIAEQRLYLFYSAEARTAFARDSEAAIEAAERHWPAVQRTLVRN